MDSAHGLFLKSEGRLKACVQVSDDLSYFRGYSPRYKLKIAGNIVLFDCVSIDVVSVGRVLVSDKIFNTLVIAIHCSNAQNVGFENPTYTKLIECSLYECVKTISMPFERCCLMMRIISDVPKE